MGDKFLTASTAARELGEQLGWEVSPRAITLLFYYRDIPDEQAPIVGGRRVFPRELLPTIARAIRRRGWYRQRTGATA